MVQERAFSQLEGLGVAVTGTNRGIGRALALAFASEGARLLLHARDGGALAEVADEARVAGAPDVRVVAGDLLDAQLGERLAAEAQSGWGRLDVVVLSAAQLGPVAPLSEVRPAALEALLAVNVTAQLRLFQALAPRLERAERSLVIWLSSGLGRFAVEQLGAYCVSKHAVEGLAKSVALEHGADGVISVALAPGLVATEMLAATLPPGTDLDQYQTPQRTARGFVRFVADVTASLNGASLDIERWLPAG